MKSNELNINSNETISDDLFNEIYSLYSNKVFNFAYKIIGNKTIAEDITQETFIQVYKNYQNFKRESKILTWIFTIAKNICFKYFKKVKRNSFHVITIYRSYCCSRSIPDLFVMKISISFVKYRICCVFCPDKSVR